MCRNIENKSQGMSFLTRASLVMLLTLPVAVLLSGGYGPGAANAALPSTITTCDGCHGNPPLDNANRVGDAVGQFPGSHGMHQVVCSTCHVAPSSTQFNHANGSIEMASQINGVAGAAYGKGPSFPVSNAAFSGSTCSGTNCHGAGTPTWGANTAKLECEKCHGSATTNPFYDTAGNTAKTAAHTGAHTAHLLETTAGKNIAGNVSCATCHAVPAASNTAGHFDTYPGAAVAITGALATKNSTLVPGYSDVTGKCTNVYCHGAGLTGSGTTDYSPTWNTPLLTGNTTATGDCSKCHQYLPPPQSGAAGSAHGGITAANQCKDCHTHVNAAGTGFDNPALHINGTVEGGTCVSCHSSVKSTYRRQVAGTGGDIDNGMASHHIKYTALSTNDCGICHDQTNHKTYTNGVSVYLKNLDSGASVLYDGTATNDGEAACVSCHDANGASSLGANALKPFTASGDNNAPVNVGWTAGAMAHSAQMGCFNCHGKSGAANTTLDPKYNGHGSPTAKMLQYAYTAGSEQTMCYNCHGTTPANGAVNAIQPLFAKTRHHSTESCDNCHNKHQAKAGPHTVGSNLAGGVLNGAAGAKLATTPAFWTAPVATNLTAISLVSGTDPEATLCFKCHSIYKTGYNATSPSGAYAMTDISKEFNPNNKGNWNTTGTLTTWSSGETAGGFHPVLASATGNLGQVNLANLVTTTFAWSKTARNTMTCGDCHGSDTATDPLGPHGSANNFILRGPNTGWASTTVASSTGMPANTFCANCHSSTYASSRFSAHVSRSDHRVPCWNCHAAVPHGGPRPGMLVAPAGAATGVGGTIAGWDTTAPYWRLGTSSSKLYIASYPSGPTTGWGQSNCGCNGTGH